MDRLIYIYDVELVEVDEYLTALEALVFLINPFYIFESLNIKIISKELKLRKCNLPPSFIDSIYSLNNIRNQLIIFPETKFKKGKKLSIAPILNSKRDILYDLSKSIEYTIMIDFYFLQVLNRIEELRKKTST